MGDNMDDNLEQYMNETVAFANQIKKSEIYKNYIESRKILDSKPNLKAQVDEFRRNTFSIQTAHNYGYYNSYEQMVNLKSGYDELLSNPLVKSFMDSEFRLTQMLWDIFNGIADIIDFDIEFLE